MGQSLRSMCGCCESKESAVLTLEMDEPPKIRTVNIFLGFFFMLNFVVGTGFLGVPYAFYHSGLLTGVITLVAVSFVSWNCAIWELEAMARAQAIIEFRTEGKAYFEMDAQGNRRPHFRIELSRKFEPSELCEVFAGRWLKVVYLVVLTVYSFLAGLSFSTVAGSAWSVNLPFNFSDMEQCSEMDFKNQVLPVVASCRNAYWLCLLLFACIVVPLSLIELKEQVIVQVIMGILRFVTIGSIVIFSVTNLGLYDDICSCEDPWAPDNNTEDITVCTNYTHSTIADMAVQFDVKAWLLSIPVFVYAHILHQGIPALTHPIKEKNYLKAYFNILFLVIGSIYTILGVAVALWFRDCTISTCTLNWGKFLSFSNVALKVLSYYIILFPSLDVVSVYPLLVLTMVNNLYTVLFCKDTTQTVNTWGAFFVRLLLKFVASLAPILVAMAVSDLYVVLNYAGLMGFFICYFTPTFLQLRSQFVCIKTFSEAVSGEESSKVSSASFAADPINRETYPLIPKVKHKSSDLYMTPYSTIFSHWPAVVVIGAVGVVLFQLTAVSLFTPLF